MSGLQWPVGVYITAASLSLEVAPVRTTEWLGCSLLLFREWEELLHAESGLPYYFNCITNETVWERPATFEKVRVFLLPRRWVGLSDWRVSLTPRSTCVEPQVMGDWVEKMAEDGKLFYVNRVSKYVEGNVFNLPAFPPPPLP